jgi:hypothetical protein
MTHVEFHFTHHFSEPLQAFMEKIKFSPTVPIDPLDIVHIPEEIYFENFKNV